MSTELLEAIRQGNLIEVQRLVTETPSLAGLCDEKGVSFLFVALYHRHEEIAQYLASQVVGLSIHEATALGNPLRLILVCERNPELINSFSADGYSPLHLAAYFARVSTLKVLLGRGADVHAPAKNEMQVQPLNSAIAGGSFPCVRLLLEAGASPNATMEKGITALMGAAGSGKEDLVQLLLSKGADPHAVCAQNLTAADYARQRGFIHLSHRLNALQQTDTETTP